MIWEHKLPCWMIGTLPHVLPPASESLPLPARQDDSLESIPWSTACHLQPQLMVSDVMLNRGQSLTSSCGPLEGTGSPQPLEATLLVLSYEKD